MKNCKYLFVCAVLLPMWIGGLSSCIQSGNHGNSANVGPTEGQRAMIDRKYGMFLHFGMNTYLNMEWSDGTAPASTYTPPADMMEKAAMWVTNAKQAGMRSIVLTTKHHDGFCLWDSKYTDYDIANPQITHKVDIVKAVADACRKEGIAFSVYYSLWDRHEPCYRSENKDEYIEFMKCQLRELMTYYGPISELWFDGVWKRPKEEWKLQEVYDFVKKLQPDCQISTNWTLGKRPIDMQERDTIVYFPADFRLWDPYLPKQDDPKIYVHEGKEYYLPFECTQTISQIGNWFNHPEDTTVRDVEELKEIFYVATMNDNCLLLNIPPDMSGRQNPKAIANVKELARLLGIENGRPFPRKMDKPYSLMTDARAQASSICKNDTLHCGAQCAVDSDVSTAWIAQDSLADIQVSLRKESVFNTLVMTIGENSIRKYALEIKDKKGTWTQVYQSQELPLCQGESFMHYGIVKCKLPKKVRTKDFRIKVRQSNGKPTIYSIKLK